MMEEKYKKALLLCITNEDYLHELLKNPKDRCLLLRIEAELLSFMNIELQVLKFPEMTSYNRMLVHRVADYFALDHNVDLIGNSVLVSKTERSKIPELSLQDKINSFGQTTADVCEIGKFQILKREPVIVTQTQKVLDNQIEITLADREKEYQLARARIFDGLDQMKLSEKISSTNLNTSETANISSSTYEFNTVSSIFSNYLATNLCELNSLNQDLTNTSELVTTTHVNLEPSKKEITNTQNGQFSINSQSSNNIDDNNFISSTNYTLTDFPPNYCTTLNNLNLININANVINLNGQSMPSSTYNMSFNLNNSTVYSNNNINLNNNNNVLNIPIKHQTIPFILPPFRPIITTTTSLTTTSTPSQLLNNVVNCGQIPPMLPPVMPPCMPMATALSYLPQNNTINMGMLRMESQNNFMNNNTNFSSNEILKSNNTNNNIMNYSMIIPHPSTNNAPIFASNIRPSSLTLSANNRIALNHPPPMVLPNMPTNTYHQVYNNSTLTNNANYIVNPQSQSHTMPLTHIRVPPPPPIPLMNRLPIPNHFPAYKLTNNDYFVKNSSSNNHNFIPQHQQLLYNRPPVLPMLISQGSRGGPAGLMPFIPFQPHVLLAGSVLPNSNTNINNSSKPLPLNQQPRKKTTVQNKSFQANNNALQNTSSNSKISSGVLKVEHPLTHNIITIKVDSTSKNGKNNESTILNAKTNQQRQYHNNNAKKITNSNKSMATAPKAGKNQKQKNT